MIIHSFLKYLKSLNNLYILVLTIIIVALLFYNNVIMENMTINIYADGKGYKINEVKEVKEDKSNVKPYTKSKTDAADYPSELKGNTPKTEETKSPPKKTETKTEEKTDAKKDSDESIAKRTSKYIDTFTAPITAPVPGLGLGLGLSS